MANDHGGNARPRGEGGCTPTPNGPRAAYFPNVAVMTHEGRKALFYDDLLRGKTVMVHFMALADPASVVHAATLGRVQHAIGDRLGRDVFLYSITSDPANDTIDKLERFAALNDAKPGWLFLTGDPHALARIRNCFFSRGQIHEHENGAMDDCSAAMIRYGNEAVGLWGSAPLHSRPEWIAQRVGWVQLRPWPQGPFKRRGPLPRPHSEA
jgi:protein SCO1/2